jgi:CxxC-x17-CxxC domain-containing protein
MFQGNWTCSDCGKEITELPFEPSSDRPVYCRECWTKRRTEREK